jgi:hypothetical protein
LKKGEETVVKISAQSEHFSVLVLKFIVNFGFLNLFRHLDPESGSGFRIRIPDPGSRLKLNADPTGFGSGSETLELGRKICDFFLSSEPFAANNR